ncbi:MAG TPA: hypothetical protein VJ951_04030 [Bacteroidales bacterium]|nr:hypothetical protein [Bacteroidales bacterium]
MSNAMTQEPGSYRRLIYIGVIVVVLGISFTTLLNDSVGELGLVFVVVGGALFGVGMHKKNSKQPEK